MTSLSADDYDRGFVGRHIGIDAESRAKMLAGFSIENMVRRYLEIYAIPPTA